MSQILKENPHVIAIRSFNADRRIRIEGQEQTRDFLVLDYCENNDLFEFMSKYARKQNESGAVGQ